MKKLSEISWNVPEETYRQDLCLSYSTLAKYVKDGFKALYDTTPVETPSLRFGSLVDCLLTDNENFDEKFIIVDFDLPSTTIMNIVEEIYVIEPSSSIYNVPRSTILNICNKLAYYPNWKDDTRANKIIVEGENYYRLLNNKGSKIAISQHEHNLATKCVYELTTNPFTKHLMTDGGDSEIEHLYQVKFKLEGEYNVRCMFDKIIVDHRNKQIFPIDLKTTSMPEENFASAFWMWKYYIQASLYKYILEQVCSQDDYFKDFTIHPFKFVVINKESLSPIVWEFDNEEVFYKTKNVKPWKTLYDEVKYYLDNPNSKYSIETMESGGVRQINVIEFDQEIQQIIETADGSTI